MRSSDVATIEQNLHSVQGGKRMTTIHYTLDPDTAPEGSILHGWQPEFEIRGKIYPFHAATQDAPEEGGGVEIREVRYKSVYQGYCPRRLGQPCDVCDPNEAAFRELLEHDPKLRQHIEELLCEEARAASER
jgi:hypothetical protein